MGALPYPTREAVFSALFAILETAPGITTFSRRMLDYSAVAPGLMPILMLWEQPELTDYRPGRGLPRDYWEAYIIIVFHNPSRVTAGNPNSAVPGATIINPLVDGVRNALAPDDPTTNSLTLGGLVDWCRVEGRTIVETGDTDAQGYGGAIIPVRMQIQ